MHFSLSRLVTDWISSRCRRTYSTIYALSSGQGKCGVAVVRISGPKSREALEKMTNLSSTVEPRRALLKRIFDPATMETIDRGLCLWFPGPNSFTGEDSVEFQVHGGMAVLEALMRALARLDFRPALPGEFTKRAFYNEKLDLTRVEGLADLIHAETEQQRRQALSQASGSLGQLYDRWRAELSQCVANLEAYIDFSEDDNIESDVLMRCNRSLAKLTSSIERHLSDGRRGEILRSGARVAIVGAPNVGKSSLLNHLLQRNAAIVTPIAGTTRDVVELNVNIADYPVILADTAGINSNSEDIVEIEGIKRAKSYAENADLVVLLVDALEYVNSKRSFESFVDNYIEQLHLRDLLDSHSGGVGGSSNNQRQLLVVVNKIDLLSDNDPKTRALSGEAVAISCARNLGFQKFTEKLAERLRVICGDPSRENPSISQSRHRAHLIKCLGHLKAYRAMIDDNERYDMVLAAQEIRMAIQELGKITGHVSTEQILDIIFKQFCIGK